MDAEYLPGIADGLAEHGFAVTDNFLSESEVDDILTAGLFEKKEAFKKAGIGKSHQHEIVESIRGDFIQWIDRSHSPPPIKIYLARMEALMHYLNHFLFLSLKDMEIHLTEYPPGSFYKRHKDQFQRDDHRRLSVICYLNRNWQSDNGGQLRLFVPREPIDVFPVAGRLVCFRSDLIEHEVLPANRSRLSLTGWILDQLADLRHL